MAKKMCPACGKQMMYRGGQYVCMNDQCPNYLIGQKAEVKSLKQARQTAKEIVED